MLGNTMTVAIRMPTIQAGCGHDHLKHFDQRSADVRRPRHPDHKAARGFDDQPCDEENCYGHRDLW